MIRIPAIVLVEDEPAILSILHRLMRDLTTNYDIITANCGAEALAQIIRRPVPLVMTAYSLPEMNGLQLTEMIKSLVPDISVVLVAAYATPALARRAHTAGVDWYLPRPFPLAQLEKIVHEVLNEHGAVAGTTGLVK